MKPGKQLYGSIRKVRTLKNREFLPTVPVRFPYFRTTPTRRPYASDLPPTLMDGRNYCVLKTEGWRQAVLLAAVNYLQACEVYSLLTTYNVDRWRISLHMKVVGLFNVTNEMSTVM